ncbi:MAG: Antitoxin VapB39 [Acidobacteria bacterium OLB17]|nr:MAG: Antitoxin VapB39 [Acidobacteria bacterium OLB17]
MRTTLDIEEDVLRAAKELARCEGTTAGKVISRLARKGLIGGRSQRKKTVFRNGVPLLPKRGVIVTNDLVNSIRDEEGI